MIKSQCFGICFFLDNSETSFVLFLFCGHVQLQITDRSANIQHYFMSRDFKASFNMAVIVSECCSSLIFHGFLMFLYAHFKVYSSSIFIQRCWILGVSAQIHNFSRFIKVFHIIVKLLCNLQIVSTAFIIFVIQLQLEGKYKY